VIKGKSIKGEKKKGTTMGRIDVILDDHLEQEFRKTVARVLGMKKGHLRKAIEEAIENWIKSKKESMGMSGNMKLSKITDFIGGEVPSENWDFRGESTDYLTHGLHPYPARMHPLLAQRLIKLYSRGGIVLDPFCGSGGVLVESKLANLPSIGVDINPLALFLSKVKTTPLPENELKRTWHLLKKRVKYEIEKAQCRELTIPEFPPELHVDYWFKPKVMSELALIKRCIEDMIEEGDLKDFFLAVFSSLVRYVSNNRPNEYKLYRLPPEELEKYNPDVLGKFLTLAENAVSRMLEFSRKCPKNVECQLILGDSRNLASLISNSIDLIVTSPPYGDSHTTVGYGQFSRYCLIWLSYNGYELTSSPRFDYKVSRKIDTELSLGGEAFGRSSDEVEKIVRISKTAIETIEQIKQNEIELKPRASRIPSLQRYLKDLILSIEEMTKVLSKGGHICIVVGNRSIRGVRVRLDRIIPEVGVHFGLECVRITRRIIPSKRHPLAQKLMINGRPVKWIDNILAEDIIVLRKS